MGDAVVWFFVGDRSHQRCLVIPPFGPLNARPHCHLTGAPVAADNCQTVARFTGLKRDRRAARRYRLRRHLGL